MPDLRTRALNFATKLAQCASPSDVVNALDQCVSIQNLNVLQVMRIPNDRTNLNNYVLGQTVWLADSMPGDYWEEAIVAARRNGGPSILAQKAWLNEGPFTFTECMRLMRPSGADRWVFNFFAQHNIRDGIYYPINSWIVILRSNQVLRLDRQTSAVLHFIASETVGRLGEIIPVRKFKGPRLTPRELAVLQRLSQGDTAEDIVGSLGISKRTIETYIDRAKTKLGAKTRTQAACCAMRLMLMK